MPRSFFVHRALLLGLALPFASGPGCGAETESAGAGALRRSFPEQAAGVLEVGSAFRMTETGFTLDEPDADSPWSGRVRLELPRDGADTIRLRTQAGFEIRVREVDLAGEGRLADQAVAYERAGGTAYWTVRSGAPEEWLHLDASVVRRGQPVASWEIDGGAPRSVADLVEIDDAAGVPRIRVTAPAAYGAGGREVMAHLAVRGSRIELSVDADHEAVLVDPVWTATTSMSVARAAAATLLPNGKVLVAGGAGTATAEVWDPGTGTWAATGAMGVARNGHTATLLGNGKVLVAGGTSTATAELYTPATNTWAATPAPIAARTNHAATRLANGNVLISGGGAALASAEIYNPTTSSFSAAAAMLTGRYEHQAVTLGSGKALVVAGYGAANTSIGSAELYDPVTNTWTAAGSLATPRSQFTATVLGNGKVLAVGGTNWYTASNGQTLGSAELFDPVAGTWSAAAPTLTFHNRHSATLLGNGKVLVAGNFGGAGAGVELYDATANAWLAASSMTGARFSHGASVLADNQRVLVAGGNVGATAELYTPLAQGAACTLAGDCASGFCVDGVCCNTACSAGACDACSVAAGATTNGTCALLTGTTCNDSNACTQTDTCQAGACVGGNPVTCAASDQCHAVGTCNPTTGVCSNPAKPDGSVCNDSNACTSGDKCNAGVCTSGTPVVCKASDQCHAVGTCSPATGMCSNPAKPDDTPCNDQDLCTTTDTCQAGVCGGTAVTCAALDQCHAAGTCDPTTGACSTPNKPEGTPCDDTDLCTTSDTCQSGACGGVVVTCPAADACNTGGSCDPANGMCTNKSQPDGTVCDDGDLCTTGDSCQAGTCGGAAVTCAAPDQCHDLGACDPATGVCSNPSKADGASCSDGLACTTGDTCQAGACQAGGPVDCTATGPCENDGACDAATGACNKSFKPDGTSCPGGVCIAGTCEQGSSSSSSSGGTGAGAGTGGSGTGAGTSSGSSGTGAGTSSGGNETGASGCGCTTAGAPSAHASWLLLGLALLRRRRSRR